MLSGTEQWGMLIIGILVLGLNSQHGARRLARAFLADPLAAEAAWERQLTEAEDNDKRAILLR